MDFVRRPPIEQASMESKIKEPAKNLTVNVDEIEIIYFSKMQRGRVAE